MMNRGERTPMEMDPRQIEDGWDVFAADGDKVGDVSEVRDNYLVVKKGFLFPSERYVPFSAISGIEHDRVYLNVNKDEIDAQGWDQAPTGASGYSEREPAAEPGMRREGERTVPLREEELRARKESTQTGQVEIGKEVVAEEKTMEVPRTREEVVVERRPVDRRPSDRPIGEGGETFEVPVREERVTTEKEPVVYEEVEVGKRPVQETERVSGTVRREEARFEEEGDVDVRRDEPRR
jgi:uncharacterized protein (TIGR02271 family)